MSHGSGIILGHKTHGESWIHREFCHDQSVAILYLSFIFLPAGGYAPDVRYGFVQRILLLPRHHGERQGAPRDAVRWRPPNPRLARHDTIGQVTMVTPVRWYGDEKDTFTMVTKDLLFVYQCWQTTVCFIGWRLLHVGKLLYCGEAEFESQIDSSLYNL